MLKNLKSLLNAKQTYDIFENKSIPENSDFFESLKKEVLFSKRSKIKNPDHESGFLKILIRKGGRISVLIL